MEYQNLKFLQDSLLATERLCSWSLTVDMQLLYTNCPEQEFFFNLFCASNCTDVIQKHFSKNNDPILASDSIGFVWTAVKQMPVEMDNSSAIHLLGPFFISDTTEASLRQRIRRLHPSQNFEDRLLNYVKDVPKVINNTAVSFACLLNYCINETTVKPENVILWIDETDQQDGSRWTDPQWHGSWLAEQRFFKAMTEGRADAIWELHVGNIGNIGGGDSLRQAKNEIIVFSVLCSRASILGGVSAEGALNLKDYYIQQVEASKTVPEVVYHGGNMYKAFLERVQKAKAAENCSPLVRSCMEYVETHIFERIRMEDISREIGYTVNYISAVFKKETGTSISDFVNQQKIEIAKTILQETAMPVSELSDRLTFSSPSYFSSVFKKYAGVSPAVFQNTAKEENHRQS